MDKSDLIHTKPKVSVVMPMYNTEKYVSEALYSILQQTLKEIEIIIIDDGSTDHSLQIVSEIALKDYRIQVYSKKNEGPSEARNMGIDLAKGEYLYYMDSDDLLEKDALAFCYQFCEKSKLDFAFFDATAFKEDLTESLNDYYTRTNTLDTTKIYTGEEVMNRLMDMNLYRSAVWLCFVKRNYIENLGLRFFPGIIHEDELYSAILHLHAQRVQYISKAFFRRRIRPNSITSNKFSEINMNSYYAVLSELKKYALTKGIVYKITIEKLIGYILNPAIYRASSFSFSSRMKQFKYCFNMGLMKHITMKNRLILLCPVLIKLKSLIK